VYHIKKYICPESNMRAFCVQPKCGACVAACFYGSISKRRKAAAAVFALEVVLCQWRYVWRFGAGAAVCASGQNFKRQGRGCKWARQVCNVRERHVLFIS
jgi:hypothetical protein